MSSDTAQALEGWVKHLPSSRMAYPDRADHWAKYGFWRLYTPLHPYVRDGALAAGIVRHIGRQDFLLGHIAPGQSVRDFVAHCIEQGYGNHFIAWRDEGELVSLRFVEDFVYQYHLRVFKDGEVRGHYEYTPECHPVLHMKEIGLEDRRHVFYGHLGDRILRD
jgi:hypothetical protein